MGLRLYQAPVESDIQSKAAAEKGPAQSRTSIRRIRSARVPDRAREHRRRVLAAAAASYNGFDPRRGSTALDPPMRSPPAADSSSHGLTPGSDQGYRALRDVAGRMGILDDRVVAMFGERWAHLHAESNPSPRRDDSNEPSPLLGMAVESEFLPRSRPPPEPYAYTLSNIRSTQAPNHPSRSATRSPGLLPSHRRPDESWLRDSATARDEHAPSDRVSSRRRSPRPSALGSSRLDGLGDRDRSLSPEMWGTLQSTLTPDPQPPSVGSSFASASAASAAAASQSTAGGAGSSRTSFTTTTLDTAAGDESTFEPPCESGCDNSDTEGDEDDEMDQIDIPNFGLRAATRRSYADAARGGSSSNNNNAEDPLELLGGIGGMQRIVRTLARREDIPDEWWAEVGLSRTLSREASDN
ncbi:hypothetical protein N656DRAFT_767545 [Canariomyces notabilis]|uniref:Uncharacterized protein n=1 Tax=Canariomyces notabilis TaxID=2074819 RepID=A0AAN6YU36_9PEZI|nr:hypothetical protein N656DRAFT_767545 [Canariomyces arenarius]